MLPQIRPNRLARVLPIGDWDSTVSGDTPGASYYRKAAIRLMELARAVEDPQIKLDLLDLASRFEKLAHHAKTKDSAAD